MSDASSWGRGRLLSVGLLAVGTVFAPLGWLLAVFAIGTRCEPHPCPSPTVTFALLGIALAGTLALGVGGVGTARYLLADWIDG